MIYFFECILNLETNLKIDVVMIECLVITWINTMKRRHLREVWDWVAFNTLRRVTIGQLFKRSTIAVWYFIMYIGEVGVTILWTDSYLTDVYCIVLYTTKLNAAVLSYFKKKNYFLNNRMRFSFLYNKEENINWCL